MVPFNIKKAERRFSWDARYRDCNRSPMIKKAGNGEKIYGVAPEALS